MARCTECNTPNDEERTTCKQCGTSLPPKQNKVASTSAAHKLGERSSAESPQPTAENRADDKEPKVVIKGYKPSLSGGNHACRIHFVNVGHEHRFEHVEFHGGDAFQLKESTFEYANRPVVSPSLCGFQLERDIRTLIDPKQNHGTYRLIVQLDLVDIGGQRLRYFGTVPLPVIPEGWSAEQKKHFFAENHTEINCIASMVDLENISGNVKINAEASSFRGKLQADAPERFFALEKAIFWAPLTLMAAEEDSRSAGCVAASIATAAGSPWRTIRLFALKNTMLGRQITTPDAAEADIQLDPPAMGHISGTHAVIRWSGDRFYLKALGKPPKMYFGTNVDTDRLGSDSPPKALKVGQVLRMPGMLPAGSVALEVLASIRHTLVLANRDKSELLVIVAPETKPAAIPADWNPTLPIFFHHHGSFWLQDSANHKETQLTEGQDIALGASGKGKLVAHPYPELNLVNYMPGTYADMEVVGA